MAVKTVLTILSLLVRRSSCPDVDCDRGECKSITPQMFCMCQEKFCEDPTQDLQWVQTREVPNNAVRSYTHLAVCKAIGADGGWHSGFVQGQRCTYEYNFSKYQATDYEVLVDPCGGRGWKWVEGAQQNMVSYDESKRFPGVKYYVCSVKSNGFVGKLFNTRNGYMCHFAGDGTTKDGHFYALVPQACV